MYYDLVVLGNSPDGQEGALTAARAGQRVALVDCQSPCRDRSADCNNMVLRDIIQQFAERPKRNMGCEEQARQLTFEHLRRQAAQLTQRKHEMVQEQLERNRVDVFCGNARFLGPHEIEVVQADGTVPLPADRILIACGTRPARSSNLPVDGAQVIDADQLLNLKRVPRSVIVIGGGVTGTEYAQMLAILNVSVTLIDGRPDWPDRNRRDTLRDLYDQAQAWGVDIRLGQDAIGIDRLASGSIAVELEKGDRLSAAGVLVAIGRLGNTEELNLPSIGLEPDERGRLWCNDRHQTWLPHIYAAGDVIGFPRRPSPPCSPEHAFRQTIGTACEDACPVPHRSPQSQYGRIIEKREELVTVGL